ncbi:MAG: tRNA (guanosine(46)-N7)-methyltransferase TrmB [Sphingomonadales bacterium]
MTRDNHPTEKFYGRRMGQTLSARKRRLLEEVLPKVSIAPDDFSKKPLDPLNLFDFPPKETWLEIGFGKGEHLAAQARANPDVGFIGCEPFINGVAGLVTKIYEEGLKNIRILADDARPLIDALPDKSIARVFLLHPDPWPKTRHARRRFVSPPNLDRLARIMKKGAELRIGTDHPVYKTWTMRQMQNRPDFNWTARRASDWQTQPEDWPDTRYQAKAHASEVKCAYFTFLRV